jgi:hypothetical protein
MELIALALFVYVIFKICVWYFEPPKTFDCRSIDIPVPLTQEEKTRLCNEYTNNKQAIILMVNFYKPVPLADRGIKLLVVKKGYKENPRFILPAVRVGETYHTNSGELYPSDIEGYITEDQFLQLIPEQS